MHDQPDTAMLHGEGGRRCACPMTLTTQDVLTGVVEHDASRDPFPVTGWDAVAWVAGNAAQSAAWLQFAFGMRVEAYSGPETGNRDHHAYVLRSGAARFVIKGAYDPASSDVGRAVSKQVIWSRTALAWY